MTEFERATASMAVDPELQAQLEQLERENRLLDERLAAKQKAKAEAPPRTPGQRFMDNVVDAFQRNPLVAARRDAFTNGVRGLVKSMLPAGLPGTGPLYRTPDAFDALGLEGSAIRAGVAVTGLLQPERASQEATTEKARRAEYAETSARDPFTKAEGGLPGKAAAGAATLAGQLVGSAADPLNLVSPQGKLATRVLGQGGMNAALDLFAQGSDLSSGVREEYDPVETVASAALGVGLAGTIESGRALAGLLKKRLPVDGGRPPLAEPEVPEAGLPRAVEDAPETPANLPVEAPEGSAGTTLAKPRAKPAGDSPGGSQPGAEAGDPWKFVDWGKMRSKERAQAAVEHLDFLKKYIKPEHVRAFVNALDRPVVDGQLGGGDRVSFMNPRYVDWEKLDASPEDILQWANIRASIFKDAFNKAGDAPKTWDEIDRTSRLLGKDLSTLIKTHADITGEGGIAARVGALQQVTLEAADAFHSQLTATRARIEAGDMSGVADFAAATQRLVLLEAMAEGSASEVARALNYMKRLKTPKAAVNDLQATLDEFADAMNGGRPVDPDSLKKAMDSFERAFRERGAAGVREEVAKARELGWSDYVGYSIVGGLLSAPKTAIRNLFGTPLLSVFQIAERYAGASIGALRTAAGLGSRERITFTEANAYVAASIDGLHDAFINGLRAFKTGTPLTPGGSIAGEVLQRPAPFQLTRERIDGWARMGLSPHTLADVAGTIYFEVVRTFGFRFSVAADEFWKAITLRQQLSGLAHREAAYRASFAEPADYARVFTETVEAIRETPTAQAFKEAREWFLERGLDADAVYPGDAEAESLARLIRSVDIEAMAADHARLMAFQDAGPIVQSFDRSLRMLPVLKWFYVPFFRTPLALLRAGIVDRNPALLGLLGENRNALARLIETAKSDEAALERGGAEADLAIARLLIGGAFMSMAFTLWANGGLVGRRGEPGDPTAKDGIKEYSLRLPSGEWVQYSSLDPVLGSQLGLVADLAQSLRDHPYDDHTGEALVGGVFAAIRNNILNKAALSGLKDFVETFFGPAYGSTDAAGGKAVADGLAQSVTSLLPLSSLQRSIAQDGDPTIRDARGFLERVQAMTPGWSRELPARRDAFGRPLVRKPGERGAFQALAISELSDDPLDLEQSRLAKALPDFSLRPGQRRFNQQPVTGEEFSRMLEVQGQLYRDPDTGLNMEEAAVELIASDAYWELSDEQKAHALRDLVQTYREAANDAMREPGSDVYQPEMVGRTAQAQIRKEHLQKDLSDNRLRRRAKALGMTGEDLERLQEILVDD